METGTAFASRWNLHHVGSIGSLSAPFLEFIGGVSNDSPFPEQRAYLTAGYLQAWIIASAFPA